MMKKIIAALACLVLSVNALAQTANGPRFKSDGSVASPTSTYSINGTTGVATLGGLTLPSQAASRIFASPSGSAGAPSFRAMALSDLPSGSGRVATTNTALNGMPSTYGTVARTGYFATGDVAPVTYTASGSACSLNAGAGDGGSQIPTSDSKCWIAAFPATGIDVRQFGAKCDASTNDTAALQAAITYANSIQPAIINLPAANLCKVNATLTFGDNVTLRGTGISGNSGLTAGVINLNPMLSLNGQNDRVENMQIIANAAGTNTSGQVINTFVKALDILQNLNIVGSCDGIDVSGNQHEIRNVTFTQAAGTGCTAVKVGSRTTLAGSTDILIDHVVVSANSSNKPDYCFLILDAGGLFITHSDALFCKSGTKIFPGANQQVIWSTFSNTFLGDTNSDFGFIIDTAASTGVVKGLSCTQCWASSQANVAGAGVSISNTAGGLVSRLAFTDLRSFGNAGDGVRIATGADVSISSSAICGYGLSGITQVASSGGLMSVSDTKISPTCASQSGAGTVGILLNTGNAGDRIVNVDVADNSGKIAGVPSGTSIVSNILGMSGISQTVAAAGTINLNAVYDTWTITGVTTTISNISSQWTGRQVTLITAANQNFATGGNICNALTSTANVPVTALFLTTCWFLK